MCWGQGGALYERQVLFPKEPRRTRAGAAAQGVDCSGPGLFLLPETAAGCFGGHPTTHTPEPRAFTKTPPTADRGRGAGQQVAAGVGPSEGRAGRCSRRLTCEAADQDRGVRVASGFRLEEPGR